MSQNLTTIFRVFLLAIMILILFCPYVAAENYSHSDLPVDPSYSIYSGQIEFKDSTLSTIKSSNEIFGPHHLPVSDRIKPLPISNEENNPATTLWIIFSLVIVGLGRFMFPLRFKETLLALWETRYFNILERERGLMNHWVSLSLYVNFLLVLSLLVYQTLKMFGAESVVSNNHPAILLLYGLLLTAGFFLLKFILIYFASWVFCTEKPTDLYLRHWVLASKFTGVAMLPLLIFNNYIPSPVILVISWGTFILLEFYRLFKGSAVGLRIPGFSGYHLILYLCTVELAPVIFILKYSQRLI